VALKEEGITIFWLFWTTERKLLKESGDSGLSDMYTCPFERCSFHKSFDF